MDTPTTVFDKRTREQKFRLSDTEKLQLQTAADDLGISVAEMCRRGAMSYHRRAVAIRQAKHARRQSQQTSPKP